MTSFNSASLITPVSTVEFVPITQKCLKTYNFRLNRKCVGGYEIWYQHQTYQARLPPKGTYKVDILTISRILGDFRSYRFFDDKTGSEHFQGIVPNIFISKSMTRLRLMTILIWFNENLFFVRSTCTSYLRCGSRTDVSRQKNDMEYC